MILRILPDETLLEKDESILLNKFISEELNRHINVIENEIKK